MPKYTVPVTIEINGSIEVEAVDRGEAINLAQQEYDRRRRSFDENTSLGGLAAKVVDGPDVQVVFAYGDDETSVEEVEEP